MEIFSASDLRLAIAATFHNQVYTCMQLLHACKFLADCNRILRVYTAACEGRRGGASEQCSFLQLNYLLLAACLRVAYLLVVDPCTN